MRRAMFVFGIGLIFCGACAGCKKKNEEEQIGELVERLGQAKTEKEAAEIANKIEKLQERAKKSVEESFVKLGQPFTFWPPIDITSGDMTQFSMTFENVGVTDEDILGRREEEKKCMMILAKVVNLGPRKAWHPPDARDIQVKTHRGYLYKTSGYPASDFFSSEPPFPLDWRKLDKWQFPFGVLGKSVDIFKESLEPEETGWNIYHTWIPKDNTPVEIIGQFPTEPGRFGGKKRMNFRLQLTQAKKETPQTKKIPEGEMWVKEKGGKQEQKRKLSKAENMLVGKYVGQMNDGAHISLQLKSDGTALVSASPIMGWEVIWCPKGDPPYSPTLILMFYKLNGDSKGLLYHASDGEQALKIPLDFDSYQADYWHRRVMNSQEILARQPGADLINLGKVKVWDIDESTRCPGNVKIWNTYTSKSEDQVTILELKRIPNFSPPDWKRLTGCYGSAVFYASINWEISGNKIIIIGGDETKGKLEIKGNTLVDKKQGITFVKQSDNFHFLTFVAELLESGTVTKQKEPDPFRGEMIWVKCKNADCGAEYQIGKKDYFEQLEEKMRADTTTSQMPALTCKDCGEKSVYRAVKCEKCGNIFYYGRPDDFNDRCPKCAFSKIEDERKKRAARSAGDESKIETSPKTIYEQWEEDDKRLRAQPELVEAPKQVSPAQQPAEPQPVETRQPEFKKLSPEEEVQAQQKWEWVLNQRKIGRLPAMGYKQVVDTCREIIQRWPESKYAFLTKRTLTDLPERYQKMYDITEEEMDVGNFYKQRLVEQDVEKHRRLVPLHIKLPKPMFVGTPQDPRVPNLEKPLGRPRPPFLAPVGTRNVALGRPVWSSDEEPIIGSVDMITDNNKEGNRYVELGPFLQYITIDLEATHEIYAIVVWHYHKQPRVYFDVVVQVADDSDFTENVTTVLNNDIDNSAGLGVGEDMHYTETAEGKLIDTKGVKSRYVRLYSNGNNRNDLNHYTEVEVFGTPLEGKKKRASTGMSSSEGIKTILQATGKSPLEGSSDIAQIITEQAQKAVEAGVAEDTGPVTVEGKLYLILVLRNRIDPITCQVVPDSRPAKVYVDTKNYPISDIGVGRKIEVIDYVQQLQKQELQKEQLIKKIETLQKAQQKIPDFDVRDASLDATIKLISLINVPESIGRSILKLIKGVGGEVSKKTLFSTMERLRTRTFDDFSKAINGYINILHELAKIHSTKLEDYDTAKKILDDYELAKSKEKTAFFLAEKVYDKSDYGAAEIIGDRLLNDLSMGFTDEVIAEHIEIGLIAMETTPSGIPYKVARYTYQLAEGCGEVQDVRDSNSAEISPPLRNGLVTAIAMDRSGSMRGEKLKRAQEAAYTYVDTSAEKEDMVSLAAFSSSAESITEPVSVADGRETLKKDILSVSSAGSTNVGAGLTIALGHLSSCNRKDKAAILLSDGRHNAGTYKSEVAQFQKRGWPVYTVAFGSDADQEMLAWIAQQTGGSFLPTGLFDISRVYHKINVQVHNGSVFRCYSDFLRPGKTLTYNVSVEPDMKKVGFFTNWQGSRMETNLVSPGNELINRHNCTDYGRYTEGQTHNCFEIDAPEPGNWQVQIVGHGLSSAGEQVNFHCFCRSDLFSNVLGFQPNYSQHQQVRVGVKLAEVTNGRLIPITGARVLAEIRKPSARLKRLAITEAFHIRQKRVEPENLIEILHEIGQLSRKTDLYDDGCHQDVGPGDGVYATTYANTTINGPYLVTIVCQGSTSEGKTFKRTLQESFQVGPIEQNSFTISELLDLLSQRVTTRQRLPQTPKRTKERQAEKIIDSVLDQLFKKRQ